MKNEKIHRELSTDEIYSIFRMCHSNIKDIIFMDNYDKLTTWEKNAIDAVHSVLYLAEGPILEID